MYNTLEFYTFMCNRDMVNNFVYKNNQLSKYTTLNCSNKKNQPHKRQQRQYQNEQVASSMIHPVCMPQARV